MSASRQGASHSLYHIPAAREQPLRIATAAGEAWIPSEDITTSQHHAREQLFITCLLCRKCTAVHRDKGEKHGESAAGTTVPSPQLNPLRCQTPGEKAQRQPLPFSKDTPSHHGVRNVYKK